MSGIGKKKITIKDVAKAAGVVPSTVSHVLHGTASISDETKKRVLDVINELGYSPNASARALRSKKSRLIGLVVPDISCEFYAQCAGFIMQEAKKDGYTVLITDSFFQNDDVQSGVKVLVERCVDGFIFIGGTRDESVIEYVTQHNIPIVFGDREYKDYPCVNFNNEIVISKLVRAFHAAGCRKFAYIGGPHEIQTNLKGRFRGYESGIKNFDDIQSYVVREEMCMKYHNHNNAGYGIFKQRFIDENNIPDIVFTTTDMLAQGIISAALDNDISVPRQLKVIGFNDMSVSEYFTPPLTTVRQDTSELGKNCYKLMREILIENTIPKNIVLEQTAVIRKSAQLPEDIIKKFDL